MRRHLHSAGVATLLLVVASLCAINRLSTGEARRSELESAILPPKAFRDWFEGGVEGLQQHGEKDVDPPMDRFAARGDHHTPTRMPSTDAQRELEEARRTYEEMVKAYGGKLTKAEEALKHNPEDASALKTAEKIEGIIDVPYQAMVKVQSKVNSMNKDLVQGRARAWNKPSDLGGSDHFVPIGQAEAQLDGGGYGHRYSVTDWLEGH